MPGAPAARVLLRWAVALLLAVREQPHPAQPGPLAADLRCECECRCQAESPGLGLFVGGLALGALLVTLGGLLPPTPARRPPRRPLTRGRSPSPAPEVREVRYRPRHAGR